jgi:carboxymethylenebutenolidase
MSQQRVSYVKHLVAAFVLLCLSACGSGGTPELSDSERAALEATAAEHAHDAPAPSPAVEPEPARPVIEQTLAYGEAANRNLIGYLAMPADAVEPQPGVIMIHEWWGLNDNIRAMARRLAGEGFVVLAVDLYDGEVAETPVAAQALMARVTATPEATLDNLNQAYAYLERYALAPRVASLGWCLGGAWSLQTALMLPTELDAMVMYYGQVVGDEAQLATLGMPMLGLFGADDASIPVADVQAFRATLNRLGKDADVRIYSGVGHAFANPSGGNYDAESAEDAWHRTVDFLNRTMR